MQCILLVLISCHQVDLYSTAGVFLTMHYKNKMNKHCHLTCKTTSLIVLSIYTVFEVWKDISPSVIKLYSTKKVGRNVYKYHFGLILSLIFSPIAVLATFQLNPIHQYHKITNKWGSVC